MTLNPWTFTVVAIAGWMNRQQQQVIDYLRTENLILREKLGTKRGNRRAKRAHLGELIGT